MNAYKCKLRFRQLFQLQRSDLKAYFHLVAVDCDNFKMLLEFTRSSGKEKGNLLSVAVSESFWTEKHIEQIRMRLFFQHILNRQKKICTENLD